ncbi:uncharacterized protein HaLaN_26349 [Haematococcus lacustris]|uniref:RRM domain-containing protein n=1 Tax=Haematococcus lacustris TaxID=44745 RepID=A0A6A0A600_HAELA|nr:uncharacterized protein HaLaN_26349 [Haematococcus lacustris]
MACHERTSTSNPRTVKLKLGAKTQNRSEKLFQWTSPCAAALKTSLPQYGRIRGVDLKTPSRPPAFAFIDFEDPRDAADAVRGRDGYDFYGSQIRVELAHGGRGGLSSDRYGGDRHGGGGDRYGGGSRGRDDHRGGGGGGGSAGGAAGLGPSPFGPSRRTDFRVIVTNLPLSASWQDLKDHMRKAGDVTFTQVMKDGRGGNMGLVDFSTADNMQTALRKLDQSEFRNPFDKTTIRHGAAVALVHAHAARLGHLSGLTVARAAARVVARAAAKAGARAAVGAAARAAASAAASLLGQQLQAQAGGIEDRRWWGHSSSSAA